MSEYAAHLLNVRRPLTTTIVRRIADPSIIALQGLKSTWHPLQMIPSLALQTSAKLLSRHPLPLHVLARPPCLVFPKLQARHAGAHVTCSTVTKSLLSVLRDELKYAKDRYRRDADGVAEPPEAWQLDDTEGKNVLLLSRNYEDEEIIIRLALDGQPDPDEIEDEYEEEGEETENVEVPTRFKVIIIKDRNQLIFDCQSSSSDVQILHMVLEPSEDALLDESMPNYVGPLFSELDETLRQAFLDYLDERGINKQLADYLVELLQEKMNTEYMLWLQKLRDFVSQ